MARPWARLSLLTAGWVAIAAAVSVVIAVDMGAPPYDALNTALAAKLAVQVGTALWLTGTALVGASWLLGARPGAGTLLGFFTIGAIINLLLPRLPEFSGAYAFVALGCACLVLYVGVCAVIVSGLGAAPTEVFMLVLHGKGLPLTVARWVVEGACVAGAVVWGGSVGPVTLLLTVLSGPAIAWILPRLRAVVGS